MIEIENKISTKNWEEGKTGNIIQKYNFSNVAIKK